MNKILRVFSLLIIFLFLSCASVQPRHFYIKCTTPLVPVYGFAQAFVGDTLISNAKITILETGKTFNTGMAGRFAFCSLPKQKITLVLSKSSLFPWNNYQTTQTATIFVPTRGLITKFQQITFQVPRKIIFASLKAILSHQHHIEMDPNKCTVATTVTAFGKTLADDPQGESGAQILLWHNHKLITNPPVIYFGIIHGKTNPFSTGSQFTSEDGGAIVYNLEPSNNLYYLSAKKKGKRFSKVAFLCSPGAFINLNPPYGPRVLSARKHKKTGMT
jgi:hypothetical protein